MNAKFFVTIALVLAVTGMAYTNEDTYTSNTGSAPII